MPASLPSEAPIAVPGQSDQSVQAGDAPLPPGALHLCQLFGLTTAETDLLAALLADEPLTLAQARQRFSLGPAEVAALVPPDGLLRAHALVEVDGADLGLLRDDDRLHPARGLREAWHGELDDASIMEGQLPGTHYIAAPPADTAWAEEFIADRPPAAMAEMLREHLLSPQPRLLWLGGCGPESLLTLGKALRARVHRPVLLLDCAALSGWPPPVLWAALRRLRRDADLRGAALLAGDIAALHGVFRALCAPRPAGQTAPVVLASPGPLSSQGPVPALPRPQRRESPFGVRSAELPPATPASAKEQTATKEEELISATREEAKRQAALDAARAMGKPLPPELLRPAPTGKPAATSPVPAAARPAPPIPARADAAPAPAGAARAEAVPAPADAAPAPAGAARAEAVPAPAEGARAEAVPAPAEGAPVEGAPVEATPADGAPAGATDPAAGPASAASPPTPPAPEEPAVEQPPLPLAPDAPLDELAKAARTTPNVQQRIELLQALAGKRSPAVILAFRHNVASPHPGVREAAEAGMVSIFGTDWNRARTIKPPVQPPRSDDNGRGPGGAF